jgi:hypothetical protein
VKLRLDTYRKKNFVFLYDVFVYEVYLDMTIVQHNQQLKFVLLSSAIKSTNIFVTTYVSTYYGATSFMLCLYPGVSGVQLMVIMIMIVMMIIIIILIIIIIIYLTASGLSPGGSG